MLENDINIKLFHFPFTHILIKSQLTNHNRCIYICNTCLIYLHSETALNKHKDECNKIETKMQTELDRKRIQFTTFAKNFLMKRKGVFPYDYLDSVNSLEKTIITRVV